MKERRIAMTLSECLMYNIRRDARVLYIRSRTPKRSEGSVMEAVTDLDRLIERRSRQSGEQRPEEVMYAESVRRYNARRQEASRAEWRAFHEAQAARHRRNLQALISHHEASARVLAEGGP